MLIFQLEVRTLILGDNLKYAAIIDYSVFQTTIYTQDNKFLFNEYLPFYYFSLINGFTHLFIPKGFTEHMLYTGPLDAKDTIVHMTCNKPTFVYFLFKRKHGEVNRQSYR